MENRFGFTSQRLDKLTCPEGADRLYVYDQGTLGLALCVTASGTKTFYVYRRVAGRPARIRLGLYPHELTIDAARKEATKVNGDIARGIDPRQSKRSARAERTFGDLFRDYIDKHVAPKRKPRTRREYERQFNLYLKPWHGKRLSDIDGDTVATLHARLGEKAPYIANRVLALVRAVHRFGRKPDPTQGIKPFPERSRQRFLYADELPAFFRALAAEPDPFGDFFLVALYTGARRSNVQAMTWADVHLARGEWYISGEQSKSGEPLVVALPAEAIEILARRQAAANASPFVFPGRGKSGHLEEPKTAWKRVLDRAGIADLRVHDLRRTLGSWLAAAGTSLPIVGKALGHRSQASTQIYARLTLAPVRSAIGAATAAMVAASKGIEHAKD